MCPIYKLFSEAEKRGDKGESSFGTARSQRRGQLRWWTDDNLLFWAVKERPLIYVADDQQVSPIIKQSLIGSVR